MRNLVLLFICLNIFITSTSAVDKPYATCVLDGQLGNQLFQIATTLSYAWDNGLEPVFPELHREDSNISRNRDALLFRLNASPLPRKIKNFFKCKNVLYKKMTIPKGDDMCLVGFFQTYKYFDHHKEALKKLFKPAESFIAMIKEKYSDLLQHDCTVAVHVRTYNKEWTDYLPFAGLQYYADAISLFPQKALFVIFSDRINWCKHHFKNFNRPMIFMDAEGDRSLEDFVLMSMLKHNIIGNSSFSWWAAYLNDNNNKTVVAPKFFHRKQKGSPNMPNWKQIPIDLLAAYPHDMYKYDGSSQSLDTQEKNCQPNFGKLFSSKFLQR